MKKWSLLILVAFSALICLSWIYKYIYFYRAYINWPYDIDVLDSYFVNLVQRIYNGLPLYGDWKKFEVINLYNPLYLLLISIGKIFSHNLIIWGRWINLVFILTGHVILSFMIYKIILHEGMGKLMSYLFAFFSFSLLMKQSYAYGFFMYVRPDSFLYFTTILGLCAYTLGYRSILFYSIVSLIAIMTKQSGVLLPTSVLLSSFLENRKWSVKFFLLTFALGCLYFFAMEIWSHGHYLTSTYLYPNDVFRSALDWRHFKYLFQVYYGHRNWVMAPLLLGYIYCFKNVRKMSKTLLILHAVDFLMLLKLARNVGASPSYLWAHWASVSAISSLGLFYFIKEFIRILRISLKRQELIIQLVLLIVVIRGVYSFRYEKLKQNYQRFEAKLRPAIKSNINNAVLINKFIKKYPNERWYSRGHSSALVMNHVILDLDVSTLGFLLNSQIFDPMDYYNSLINGRYKLVHMLGKPLVQTEKIFDDCFDEILKTFYFYLIDENLIKSPVRILRHNSYKKSCRPLQLSEKQNLTEIFVN